MHGASRAKFLIIGKRIPGSTRATLNKKKVLNEFALTTTAQTLVHLLKHGIQEGFHMHRSCRSMTNKPSENGNDAPVSKSPVFVLTIMNRSLDVKCNVSR